MQKETGVLQKNMLKQWENDATKIPEDYIICTGRTYSIKEFINYCIDYLKLIQMDWQGIKYKIN